MVGPYCTVEYSAVAAITSTASREQIDGASASRSPRSWSRGADQANNGRQHREKEDEKHSDSKPHDSCLSFLLQPIGIRCGRHVCSLLAWLLCRKPQKNACEWIVGAPCRCDLAFPPTRGTVFHMPEPLFHGVDPHFFFGVCQTPAVRSMAADTHDQRVFPVRPRPLLVMVKEIAANSSDAPRETRRKSTATQGETTPWGGRRRHWATSPWRLLLVKVAMLLWAGALREVAAEEVVDIRPVWMPLEGQDDAGASSVAEVFRSSEVLQMYHLQVRARCREDGHTPSAAKSRCWSGCVVFKRVLDTRASLSSRMYIDRQMTTLRR